MKNNQFTCHAVPHTHPNRLATLATLFGLHPQPVQTGKVLELACCSGDNIIAIAQTLPGAQCIGIDISEQQITQANTAIKALNLKNVQCKQMNILEIDAELGQFDYIIAHNIYSYATPDVQEKILSICKNNLSEQGIAYISYDTKPGWNMQQSVRDVLQYHARYLPNQQFSPDALQTMLQAVGNAIANNKSAYNTLLQSEIKKATELSESYLAKAYQQHEAVYFHQFIDRMRAHKLNYLGDINFPSMLVSNFPEPVQAVLKVMAGNLLLQEQTMDLLNNRQVRHTLLCHDHVVISRNLTPAILKNIYIASALRASKNEAEKQTFESQLGNITTDKTVVKAAFNYLAQQWPQAIAFSDILIHVQQEIGHPLTTEDNQAVTNTLLRCYSSGLIELHVMPLPLVTAISSHPQTSALIRYQAKKGNIISNLRCESLTMNNQICLKLLPHLNGEYDQPALIALLKEWLDQGLLKLQANQANTQKEIDLTDEAKSRILTQVLNESLLFAAKAGLLQA